MFRNPESEIFFTKNGYLKDQLISSSEIEEIKSLYNSTKLDSGVNDKAFFTSIWSDNIAYKKEVDKELKRILQASLENKLHDFRAIFSNFMVKKSGENSSLQPHQDWSFVDEPIFQSITVWIPLIDVDSFNGALSVLPQSHLLDNYIRPRFSNSPFSSDISAIEKQLMKNIAMKAGDALFINSRTIHSSPPNLSMFDRIAVSIVIAPKNSLNVHYIKHPQIETSAYKIFVEDSFYIDFSCFEAPEDYEDNDLVSLTPCNYNLDFISLKSS